MEIHIYPEVDHAFFNDQRPDVYNAKAAEDAGSARFSSLPRTFDEALE